MREICENDLLEDEGVLFRSDISKSFTQLPNVPYGDVTVQYVQYGE